MVEFGVRVPESTPHYASVFLAGDGSQLGDWSANRVCLRRDHDGVYRVNLNFPAGFRGRYLITLGSWREAESDGRGHEVAPRYFTCARSGPVEVEVRGWGRDALRYHHDFPSRFLPHPRTISVWLPPGYDFDPHRRFPVLYMHDGQNLFDPRTAFAGNPWWADEVAEREIRAGRVRQLLIVGVANSVDRLREYGPRLRESELGEDRSRDYGRFLVEEVKPFIDATYRTQPEAKHTGVGGSSMGGLISLQLCKWYPRVFGLCAAMSPSLWWDREHFLESLHESPEWMEHCRVWLDMGTREGGSEQGMLAMVGRARRLAQELGGRAAAAGKEFCFDEVQGGEHNEATWGGRLDRVLRFLFPADRP